MVVSAHYKSLLLNYYYYHYYYVSIKVYCIVISHSDCWNSQPNFFSPHYLIFFLILKMIASFLQCWVQNQYWSKLFLVLVLRYLQSVWEFYFCARSWSRHLWSRPPHLLSSQSPQDLKLTSEADADAVPHAGPCRHILSVSCRSGLRLPSPIHLPRRPRHSRHRRLFNDKFNSRWHEATDIHEITGLVVVYVLKNMLLIEIVFVFDRNCVCLFVCLLNDEAHKTSYWNMNQVKLNWNREWNRNWNWDWNFK